MNYLHLQQKVHMNKEDLIAYNKAAVYTLLAQYTDYKNVEGILSRGTEPKEIAPRAEETQTRFLSSTTTRTSRSWHLFSDTHQRLSTERRKELEECLHMISDAMKFANPAIWIMYKGLAYVDTGKHNPTVQAFVDHTRYEQTCGKRIAYVNSYLEARHHGNNLFSDTLLPLNMDTVEAANSDFILDLCMGEEFMRGWEAGEFNSKGKWAA